MQSSVVRKWIIVFSLGLMFTDTALPQITGVSDQPRPSEIGAAMKESQTNVAAALSGSQFVVSKTAFVDGENVCGVISIRNGGGQPATIGSISDTLEVHFPSAAPPALSAGSTRNWFKVADVPIPLPEPIAAEATTTIDYCFSLCLAADFAGANSMRNVVTVDIVEPSGRIKTFTTRSTSFAPPTLDCQACCMGDGTCIDTVSDNCVTTDGLPQGVGTDCATSECPEACCHADGTCSDTAPTACEAASGQPAGAGTNCATTECCRPLGSACNNGVPCCGENAFCTSGTCCIGLADSGCAENSDCCEEDGVAICQAGTCCAPNRAPDSCHDTADCCDAGATCSGGTCCIPLGDTGCTNLVGNDCCSGFGAVICESGKCCAPTGAEDSCFVDSDCCDPGATCNGGTCCVRRADMGCTDASDCCENDGVTICDAGRCCAPNGFEFSCHDAGDCCDANASCNSGTCCVPLGDAGCTQFGADCCDGFGTEICQGGRCCAPTGADDSCFADTDCCDPDATCNGGTCCVRNGDAGCVASNECCDSFCVEGACCIPSGNDCDEDLRCCAGLSCEAGICCKAPGSACSIFDACCGTHCIDGTCCDPPGQPCGEDGDCCNDLTCSIVTDTCCIDPGNTGCTAASQCCNYFGVIPFDCEAGKCCNPIGGRCDENEHCCNPNASCEQSSNTCCIASGDFGCTDDSDCCGRNCHFQDRQDPVGRCCQLLGEFCGGLASVNCCHPSAICSQDGTANCCLPQFIGCAQDSDCCSGFCSGGLCDAPIAP